MTSISSSLPPLLPTIDAILVLDGDGNRLAGKYYENFLSAGPIPFSDPKKAAEIRASTEELRAAFERQVQGKVNNVAARSDAAEVVAVAGKTVVFCGGSSTINTGNVSTGDVRVVLVGMNTESELVLAHYTEGIYQALSHLMGGVTDRGMVLDNLELVLLLIDEHCDGGIILETDPNRLAGSVLLRDEHEQNEIANGNTGGPPGGQASGPMSMAPNMGEMTIAQALKQARNQFLTNIGSRDGM